MTNSAELHQHDHYQVIVIGAGPAGIACATELRRRGIENIVLIERESKAGGIPRHCAHSPFGLREFRRYYTGPRYAENLVRRARIHGVKILTNTTVVKLGSSGALLIASPVGTREIYAERVVISTGARETPRSARLISGSRSMGITTTGALQSMVYLQNKTPFRRPIIVGTELVSFSALLTCRHAGIRPAAISESQSRVTAWMGSGMLAKALGIPLKLNTKIQDIVGRERVQEVHTRTSDGQHEIIPCDGVVFTGQFLPEVALLRNGHLEIDSGTGGPVVDQFGRCSDPTYFTCGNVVRPVETAGWCWYEGVQTARHVVASLAAQLPTPAIRIPVYCADTAIKYVVPQVVSVSRTAATLSGLPSFQLRVSKAVNGNLRLTGNQETLISSRVRSLPERRILLPTKSVVIPPAVDHLALNIDTN
ncbi:MAG: FAD-dependent oxidoreductase [Arenicellales bacterium]